MGMIGAKRFTGRMPFLTPNPEITGWGVIDVFCLPDNWYSYLVSRWQSWFISSSVRVCLIYLLHCSCISYIGYLHIFVTFYLWLLIVFLIICYLFYPFYILQFYYPLCLSLLYLTVILSSLFISSISYSFIILSVYLFYILQFYYPLCLFLLCLCRQLIFTTKGDLFGHWDVEWNYAWDLLKEPPSITPKGLQVILKVCICLPWLI